MGTREDNGNSSFGARPSSDSGKDNRKNWRPARDKRMRMLSSLSSPLLLLLLGLLSARSSSGADDQKSAGAIVRSRGFNVDEFDVISDSYVLKVYRIINPLADPRRLHKVPVIATHGVTFDMATMMASSQNARPRRPKLEERVTLYALENGTDDRGLHFYLSNNNYDVWMFEARATTDRVMRRVKGAEANRKSFWDFSLDEQALIDVPTVCDFVLRKTGASRFAFIGFSQSTTMMFALLSMRPDYSRKVAAFVALAPVVYTTQLRGLTLPVMLLRQYLSPSVASSLLGGWKRKLLNGYVRYLCSISLIKYTLCKGLMDAASGPDHSAVIEGAVTENALKTTSFKSFDQFLTNRANKDFRMYDYKDETRNMEEYGQVVPPQYNVSKIDLKSIVLFRGTNDYFSTPVDQMLLLSKLRVPLYEDHILEDYAHLDFIISPTVTRDINEPILRALDRLTGRPVRRVSHTLGLQVNPQVEGTQLEMDVRKDNLQAQAGMKANPALQPEANRQPGGVVHNEPGGSVAEQLGAAA